MTAHAHDDSCWCEKTEEELDAILLARFKEADIIGKPLNAETTRIIDRIVGIFNLERYLALSHDEAVKQWEAQHGHTH